MHAGGVFHPLCFLQRSLTELVGERKTGLVLTRKQAAGSRPLKLAPPYLALNRGVRPGVKQPRDTGVVPFVCGLVKGRFTGLLMVL